MDDYVFEPTLRKELKQAMVDVLLKDGKEMDVATEAGELFVRLIERGLARLSRTELLTRPDATNAPLMARAR
jgi:hypothetical protein